jgi:4,5-dihydroxyphthalate decarboxylase
MLPLYTGEVAPAGIDLAFEAIDSPREIFDRMSGRQEFDAAELSASEFISQMAAGDRHFVAIPVFPSRVFRHGLITINKRSGIRTPKDLEGKRIGVPLYTMSAAVWIRGHLQHEYGVDLSSIIWVQGAINKTGTHGTPTVKPLLRPVNIQPNDSGETLSDLLAEDKIDAIIGTSLPASIKTDPDIARLFPNFREVEREYFIRTGIFPIMHLLAIRRELYEAHPFIAKSLYDAFDRSKNLALEKLRSPVALRYMLPWMTADADEIDTVFGGDPWPYGIEPNRATVRALVQYMQEQFLIDKAMPIEELFVPVD